MKKNIIFLLLMSAFIAPAIAGKPDWAGKGKPTDAQKSVHESTMEAKEDIYDRANRFEELVSLDRVQGGKI